MCQASGSLLKDGLHFFLSLQFHDITPWSTNVISSIASVTSLCSLLPLLPHPLLLLPYPVFEGQVSPIAALFYSEGGFGAVISPWLWWWWYVAKSRYKSQLRLHKMTCWLRKRRQLTDIRLSNPGVSCSSLAWQQSVSFDLQAKDLFNAWHGEIYKEMFRHERACWFTQ